MLSRFRNKLGWRIELAEGRPIFNLVRVLLHASVWQNFIHWVVKPVTNKLARSQNKVTSVKNLDVCATVSMQKPKPRERHPNGRFK